MARLLARTLFSLSLFAGACSSAYADRIAAPSRPLVPIAVAPEAVRSPYTVEVVAEDGDVLGTFFHKGRYYVHGASGQRYTIRVSNPTSQRVEAVVSVDGLDVIDGENGDIRKRGYVVPAYGEVRIEGWRTSLADVASFRFSSVKSSYAGKKAKARNVGVVAVAIFAEQPQQQIIVDDVPGYDYEEGGDYGEGVETYLDRRGSAGTTRSAPPKAGADHGGGRGDGVAARRPAPVDADDESPSAPPPTTSAVGGNAGPSGAPMPVREQQQRTESDSRDCCGGEAKRERLGLGTEYGESRYSAASYTRFVRSGAAPVAVAELRYNDTSGLKALGIFVDPEPDADEIMTRETADPFPGDRGFARPPAGIR